jgi:hypothetical protein
MSTSLGRLLQDADPVRREAPPLDAERERLRLTILRNASVTPSTRSMRARLAFVAAVGIAVVSMGALGQIWMHGTTPVLAAVQFEVRLAEEKPVPGLVVAQVPDSGRLIYLHPEIVVSNDDIAQSWVSQESPDGYSVAVQFLPSGAERMRQATANHVGRLVAILINGNVVIAPVVRSPIGDSAVITGHYTRAEAERIANGMRRQ